jgi:hypothetical protein
MRSIYLTGEEEDKTGVAEKPKKLPCEPSGPVRGA